LKNDLNPSWRTISRMMVAPETSLWKCAFWIRVLTTSSGAATVMDATAPAMDATKSEWFSVVRWFPREMGIGTRVAHGTGVPEQFERVEREAASGRACGSSSSVVVVVVVVVVELVQLVEMRRRGGRGTRSTQPTHSVPKWPSSNRSA
jgi:hypothetical protein